MAVDFLRATGAECPVQAHRFALEAGFSLRPVASGGPMSIGDTLVFDGTVPMDEQESVILALMAQWVLGHVGVAVTAESIAELIDVWLDANDSAADGEVASGLSTST